MKRKTPEFSWEFMKICPVCQTSYADESNVFCLNDGTALIDEQAFRRSDKAAANKSNVPLAAAILGGFLIFAVIVGGVGLYLFGSRNQRTEDNKNQTKTNQETEISLNNGRISNTSAANQTLPSVQIESNKSSNVKVQTAPLIANSNSAATLGRIIASASSVRKQDKGNFYFPNFVSDSNPSTAWCEGADGAGTGEWLNIEFGDAVRLRQIKIQPGYFKNQQVWRDNNRVAEALFEFSDGTSKTARFNDQMQTQTVDVGLKQTRWVRITIEDVYQGAYDAEDTLISDVSFVTEP